MTTTLSKEKCKTLFIQEMEGVWDKMLSYIKESINVILEYKGKKWVDVVSEDKKNELFKILDLIKQIRPEQTKYIDKIIIDLNKESLVFDEKGQWDPINKLNTNKYDSILFIGDLLEGSKIYDIYDIYRDIKKRDFTNFIKFLNEIKKHPKFIWDNFLNEKEKYTKNIKKNSNDGEIIENYVKDHYFNNGWEIIYKGGDGDFIDMKFGLDLITKKDDVYEFVQVKKVSSIENVNIEDKDYVKVNGNILVLNSKLINVVGYATLDGDVLIVKNQNYFYKSNSGLVKTYGLPIPNKTHKYEIFVEV